MPKPIITGTLQPVRQSLRIRYDPQQGSTVTQEFESAGDNCGGLAAQFQRQGAATDLDSNPLRSRLTVTESRSFFADEQSLERWELFSNQDSLAIWEAPNAIALGQPNLAILEKAYKSHQAGKEVSTDGWSSGMVSMWALMLRGITVYPVSKWVIRYTANISNTYSLWTNANSGIGTIYSTSQLGVPGGRLLSTVQAISAPAADAAVTWGWLKTNITEVTAANNRVDVSAEFILGQWPIFLYV